MLGLYDYKPTFFHIRLKTAELIREAAAGRREQQAAGTHFRPEKLSSFFFQATKPEDSFDINNSDKLP